MSGNNGEKIFGLSEKRFLLLIFLLSIVFRSLYTAYLRLLIDYPIINDEQFYDVFAKNLITQRLYGAGPVFRALFSPGFPLFLAAIYKLFGISYFAAGIANSLVSSFIPLAVYITARELFDKKSAAIAAIVAVVYPFFIYYAPRLLTENFITLLPLLAVYFLLRYRKGERPLLFLSLSALMLGLSTLTKPSTIFLPLFLILYIFLGASSLPAKLRHSVIYMAVFFVVLLPWGIRNHYVIHSFMLTNSNSGKTFLGGNHFFPSRNDRNMGVYVLDLDEVYEQRGTRFCGDPEARLNKEMYGIGLSEIKRNREKVPVMLFKKFINFWSFRPDPLKDKFTGHDLISLFTFGPILLLFIPGFIRSFRISHKIFIFHLFIIYFTMIALVFWGTMRFRLPIEPYIIILASFTAVSLYKGHFLKSQPS